MKRLLLIVLLFAIILPVSAKVYDFSDEASENYIQNLRIVNIPRGQIIYSRLNADIDSQNNSSNDVITTQLIKDWYYMGQFIAPEGSLISGKITAIENSSDAQGNAKVNITFTQIVRPDNVTIDIQSRPICITVGESRLKSGAKLMGQGVMKSVISSRSFSNVKTRTINGAIAGGYTFLTTKGEELNIPFGTEFKINIVNSINTLNYEN